MASSATFQVYRDAAEQWRWRLVHDNGNVIAEGGQGYTTKRRAVDGIESVRLNAPDAAVEGEAQRAGSGDSSATFEVYEDVAGRWRWRLVHDNGNIVAEGGQGYASTGGAVSGIESVQGNAPEAKIEEHRVEEIGDP